MSVQSTMTVQDVSDLRSSLLVDKHAEYIASFEKVFLLSWTHHSNDDLQL